MHLGKHHQVMSGILTVDVPDMTGKKYFFENLKTCDHGTVIFGDGNKGRLQGTGNICSKKSPKLEDMLLVKGLVSNII